MGTGFWVKHSDVCMALLLLPLLQQLLLHTYFIPRVDFRFIFFQFRLFFSCMLPAELSCFSCHIAFNSHLVF
ncbi:hypothetical protein BJX62DRAFT_210835 [Aspergillus germanicus]